MDEQLHSRYPSEQTKILSSLIGCTLYDIVKIISDDFPIESIYERYHIAFVDIFHLFGSPVVLKFDKGIIGICSYEEEQSVLVWLEADNMENYIGNRSIFYNKHSLFTFSVRNRMFAQEKFESVLGMDLINISYYKRNYKDISRKNRKCKAGIGFKFSNGQELVFSTDFLPQALDLSICFKDEIPYDVVSQLEEVVIH
jgi:hypothetical protein